MQPDRLTAFETSFKHLTHLLQEAMEQNEHFALLLNSEQSQFLRFNQAKVRQAGTVQDGTLSLTLMWLDRSSTYDLPFTGDRAIDEIQLRNALADLRREVPQLPVDPYLVLPVGSSTSREVYTGELLAEDAVAETLLSIVSGLDFAGIYAAGTLIRGYADSAGQNHWFVTNSFALDYSLFTPDGQAVKGTLAGRQWEHDRCLQALQASKAQLKRLAQPPKPVPKGNYRTYFSPAAVAELGGMLSWGGLSEAALQQSRSALGLLQAGEKSLSSLFTLRENFQRGTVPRFNDLGEIAPSDLPLITHGKLVNTLVSSRSAKEYGRSANGADASESLRSPEVDSGSLEREQILSELGTGLYLSNLHYLNWSDRPTGRITGMTRYACFWVEEGEIAAPIENLRFDESLYRFWGENLLALTDFQEFVPEVGTYGSRQLGGIWTPGMLVEDFTYTL
ncbi:MAG TPA: TldD/PmbA family protein [Thermosynechococcaceae cyanobacterium]